jgi:hypothetical protein
MTIRGLQSVIGHLLSVIPFGDSPNGHD